MRTALLALLPILAAAPASAQDVAAGQRLYGQCAACHAITPDGRSGATGPNLYGVVNRRAAQVESYTRWSAPMKAAAEAGLVWDLATLDRYITRPRDVVPGTTMVYIGMRNPEQRANLLAYLETLGAQPASPAAAPGAVSPGAAPATP